MYTTTVTPSYLNIHSLEASIVSNQCVEYCGGDGGIGSVCSTGKPTLHGPSDKPGSSNQSSPSCLPCDVPPLTPPTTSNPHPTIMHHALPVALPTPLPMLLPMLFLWLFRHFSPNTNSPSTPSSAKLTKNTSTPT